MPARPPKLCSSTGCPKIATERGRCEAHARAAKVQRWQQQDSKREKVAARGYGSKWRTARAAYLLEHPLCVKCKESRRVSLATVVDHITPHKGDPVLMWSQWNWQALCKPCHDKKTATEDGAFVRSKARGRG